VNTGIPMGFLLVVGSATVLISALQILHLAYTVDVAKSVRRLVELEEIKAQPNPILSPATISPKAEKKRLDELAKYKAKYKEDGRLPARKDPEAAPTMTGPA
jgi:hypothetical protein